MKSPSALKAQIESAVGAHFAAQLTFREWPPAEGAPTGVAELDALTGGLPRGAITDLYGPASSGRTSLLMSILAGASARGEVCAVVDASDAFNPASAAAAGADLARVLWVRCGGRPDHALKAADLLIQGGGFGLVALDFGDVAPEIARRIPIASWFRYRRAVEDTPTVLLVVEREPTVKSCASLILEAKRADVAWSGAPGCSRLLRAMRLDVLPRKPVRAEAASFNARAVG
jgi:recombination protein RecA